jgi:hypothetical protein
MFSPILEYQDDDEKKDGERLRSIAQSLRSSWRYSVRLSILQSVISKISSRFVTFKNIR